MTSRQCADPVCLHARRSGFFFAFRSAALIIRRPNWCPGLPGQEWAGGRRFFPHGCVLDSRKRLNEGD